MPRSYKDRLINFELPPPKGVWDHIDKKLSEETNGDYVTRLFDFEILPPVAAWGNIKDALNSEASVVLMKPRPRSLGLSWVRRVAIAAAVIGIAITGIQYFKNNKLTVDGPALIADVSNKPVESNNLISPVGPSQPATSQRRYDEQAAVYKPLRKRFDDNGLQNTRVEGFSLFTLAEPRAVVAAKPIRNALGDIIQDRQILNDEDPRYIDITSPSGQQTKISAKFMNMVMFLNDDNDIDLVDGYFDKNFLQGLTWKSRFRDWRNKIISTSFVPSSTNFMDILELKELIQKDK